MEEKFDIGEAIERIKAGLKVKRVAWHGTDKYIYLVPAAKYPAQRNTNKSIVGKFKDDMVPYTAYIAMKTENDEVTPWNPGHADLIEVDWYEVN